MRTIDILPAANAAPMAAPADRRRIAAWSIAAGLAVLVLLGAMALAAVLR